MKILDRKKLHSKIITVSYLNILLICNNNKLLIITKENNLLNLLKLFYDIFIT